MRNHLNIPTILRFVFTTVGFIFSFFMVHSNVSLHEWTASVDESNSTINEKGETEHIAPLNLGTWIFEDGTFIPMAKLQGEHSYSIITDHLGTPVEAYDEDGTKVWSRELNIYGETRKEFGVTNFIPFKYQGQYEDIETRLFYNRFRYYSPGSGMYISQDPTRLDGGKDLYAYVWDVNAVIDPSGLSGIPSFDVLKDMAENSLDFSTATDGAVFWSGKNMEAAQNWASANGKTTLEQTKGRRYLNDLKLFDDGSPLSGKQAAEIWDIASKRFAEGASGNINVFSNYARKMNKWGMLRTWWRIEKPALLKNKNVLSITKRKPDGSLTKGGHIKCH